MFGILSIALFINFSPNSELKGFVPRSKPVLTRFEPNPFPNCAAILVFFWPLFF